MIQGRIAAARLRRGGRIYANRDTEYFTVEDPDFTGPESDLDAMGNTVCAVYGCEESL